jgi:hypothetical protein
MIDRGDRHRQAVDPALVGQAAALGFCLLTPLNRPLYYLQLAALASLPRLLTSLLGAYVPSLAGLARLLGPVTLAAAFVAATALASEALRARTAQGAEPELGTVLGAMDWPELVKTALSAGVVMLVLGWCLLPATFVAVLFAQSGYLVAQERMSAPEALQSGLSDFTNGRALVLFVVIALPWIGLGLLLQTFPGFISSVAHGVLHAGDSTQGLVQHLGSWLLDVVCIALFATAIADNTADRFRD